MGGVKSMWRSNITTLNYFISLETANTQKSEMFLLRMSLGKVNASVLLLADTLQFIISVLEKNF